MAKKNTTKTERKQASVYEPNKVTFGVAAIGALALLVFAIFLVTSVR